MSEWWTYRLSDFLLFSPSTYYRLFELYNAEIWPAQILMLGLGSAVLALWYRGGAGQRLVAAVILAFCWLFVAWAYHLERYATINWAAPYFAAAFAIEAALLIWCAAAGAWRRHRPARDATSRAGLGIVLFALWVQPAIAPLLGRPWTQAEVFGVAPDPTAVATLGLLVAADRSPWSLMIIPLLWCAVSGATLWTMDSPDAAAPPVLALLALVLAALKMRSRQGPPPDDGVGGESQDCGATPPAAPTAAPRRGASAGRRRRPP